MDPNNPTTTQPNPATTPQQVVAPQMPQQNITPPPMQMPQDPIQAASTQTAAAPVSQPSSSHKNVIIGVGLIILIAVVIGSSAFVLMNSSSQKTAQQATTQTNIANSLPPTATPTLIPTPTDINLETLTVDSPATDVAELQQDIKGL